MQSTTQPNLTRAGQSANVTASAAGAGTTSLVSTGTPLANIQAFIGDVAQRVGKTWLTHRDVLTLTTALTAASIVASNYVFPTRAAGTFGLVGFGSTAVAAMLNPSESADVNLSSVRQALNKVAAQSKSIAHNTLIAGVLGRLLASEDFRGASIGVLAAAGVGYASVVCKEGNLLLSLEQMQSSPELFNALMTIGGMLGYSMHDPKILITGAVVAVCALALEGRLTPPDRNSEENSGASVQRVGSTEQRSSAESVDVEDQNDGTVGDVASSDDQEDSQQSDSESVVSGNDGRTPSVASSRSASAQH